MPEFSPETPLQKIDSLAALKAKVESAKEKESSTPDAERTIVLAGTLESLVDMNNAMRSENDADPRLLAQSNPPTYEMLSIA